MRRSLVIGALALVAVLLASTIAFVVVDADDDDVDPALLPMVQVAESFPVPPGATTAFPEHTNMQPLQVVKGWNTTGTLDEACQIWRDAYRTWLGPQAQAAVTGELTNGVSCTFSGPKDGYSTMVVVATYSAAPPLVTLQVSRPGG